MVAASAACPQRRLQAGGTGQLLQPQIHSHSHHTCYARACVTSHTLVPNNSSHHVWMQYASIAITTWLPQAIAHT